MLLLPDLWFGHSGVCHPPAPCTKGNDSGGFCRICSTKSHFSWAGGWCSGPGRSTRSSPLVPLQVPHTPSQPAAGSESRRFANKHSKKALKASLTLGILLGMFFVAWLPFFVTNVTQVRTKGLVGFFFSRRVFKRFNFEPSGVGSQTPTSLAGKTKFPQGANPP